MTRMSCRATVSCRWTVCCGRGWSALFPEAPQSRPAIPPASPVECYFMLWHEQASPLQAHLHGALLIGVWQASMHRRYKMPPATTSPGQTLFLVYQHIRKISICAQANFHSQKPRVGLCMTFMIGFLGRLALPAKVHPKPFAGVPQHCGCLNLSQQGILE